jgi:hypothetical protein
VALWGATAVVDRSDPRRDLPDDGVEGFADAAEEEAEPEVLSGFLADDLHADEDGW